MNQIPYWYFVLSAITLVIIAGTFTALCVLVFQLIKAVKQIQPQVSSLATKVNDELLPQVKSLVTKVDTLTEKVTIVADNARIVSDTARGTVQALSGRANSMSSAVESLTTVATNKLGAIAPYLGIVVTVAKLWKSLGSRRSKV